MPDPRARTLGTLTDTDVKERRTITLGTLTGRLEATGEVGGRVWVRVECGGVVAYTRLLPAETAVEVRS